MGWQRYNRGDYRFEVSDDDGASWATLLSSLSTVQILNTSGSFNDWAALGSGYANTAILWTGTADLSITGIAGGVSGQILTIRNFSSNLNKIYLYNYHTASATNNRFFNFLQEGVTVLGYQGYATYVYNGNNYWWELIGYSQGCWIDIPYNAANFSGSGSISWLVEAGDINTFKYRLDDTTLSLVAMLSSTSVSGSGTQLFITLPNGYRSKSLQLTPAMVYDNSGSYEMGYVQVNAGGTTLGIGRPGGAAYNPSSHNTHIYATATFEVV